MRLRQLKIRGLGSLPETDWIALSVTTTLLRFPDKGVGRQFLKAVQCINPPSDCRIDQPFKDLPLETVSASGYRRVIAPEKRTIVFGIFDTPSSLVRELGAITPPLYETDRVEVGRRLDYSRWINFVEIASSSRWSEVSEDIRNLLNQQSTEGDDASNIQRLLAETASSERIKGAKLEQLATWLTGLQSRLPEPGDLDDILEKVLRANRFSEARALIERRLPQFLTGRYGEELQRLPHRKAIDNDYRALPVILIDCFDTALLEETGAEIPEVLFNLAKHCQILCFAEHSFPGWNLEEAQIIDVAVLN